MATINTRDCSDITGIPVRTLEDFRSERGRERYRGKAPEVTHSSNGRAVYELAEVTRWVEAEYQEALRLYQDRISKLEEVA